MTPEEFRAAGHALIDWIADYRQTVNDRPVCSAVAPGDIRRRLPDTAPLEGRRFEEILHDLDDIIVPGITQVQHPMHFAWFPANATLASALGDFTSTGLGALGITWQAAPALTELEEVVCDWMRDLVGLSAAWHGSIQDAASTTCLVAMVLARERALSDGAGLEGGLQSAERPLTVYSSTQAHSSVVKAAVLAGFGKVNIREVDTDPVTFSLRPDHLETMMAADRRLGRQPAAVVATVGTTGTTAMDPVGAIAEVARSHDAWVHIDAAMAGSAMLLPECRHLWEGVEAADSLSWNPHKWMGTAFDTSLFYVRDVEHLTRIMSTNPSYLRSTAGTAVTELRDWGIPLGRRFRALKLWFHLGLEGAEGIRRRLRRDLANAQWLRAQVEALPPWRVVAPVALQTVCVRHEPAGVAGDELDAHTLRWVEAINRSGRAHLTPALLDGRWMARVSVGSELTERAHVSELWAMMQQSVG